MVACTMSMDVMGLQQGRAASTASSTPASRPTWATPTRRTSTSSSDPRSLTATATYTTRTEPPWTTTSWSIGSGIGGMESSIKLGDMGYKVLLVEKEASVGGRMILLCKVFPTLDCASCISGPKMSSTINHPNITTMTYSEVTGIKRDADGALPRATSRRSRRFVDWAACTGCNDCQDGLHRRRARPVQRRPRRPPRRVHRLPAGRAEEGGADARGHLAVHRRLPGRHQGARLRLARAQRQGRGGVPAGPRRHPARGHARPGLLRARASPSAPAPSSRARSRSG